MTLLGIFDVSANYPDPSMMSQAAIDNYSRGIRLNYLARMYAKTLKESTAAKAAASTGTVTPGGTDGQCHSCWHACRPDRNRGDRRGARGADRYRLPDGRLMAILNAPVALLDQDYVQNRLIGIVTSRQRVRAPAVPTLWTMTWEESAARLWTSRLAKTSEDKSRVFGQLFSGQNVNGSILIVVVNRRKADVTLGVSKDSAFYGQVLHAPVTVGWDEEHKHTLDLATNIVPAAVPDEKLLGVGLVSFVIDNPSYGCGGAFRITLGDTPNEDDIWFGAQLAYGAKDNKRFGMALTNDHVKYTGLEDFYTKECDDKREIEADLKLAVGHGKDKAATYTVTARTAPLAVSVPGWAVLGGSDSATTNHYQVILDIS